MCSFHSIIGRMLGDTAELYHDLSDSHSSMISTSKWRENKPNEIILVFEAEWDGAGAFPSDNSLIRNAEDCPEKLKDKIRNHYKKLAEAVKSGKHLDKYFYEEKYEDIFTVAFKNGWRGKFPTTIAGSLDLRGCDLKGITLPTTIGGSLYLRGCDLKGITLPTTIGGFLDLRGCDLKGITIPKKFKVIK